MKKKQIIGLVVAGIITMAAIAAIIIFGSADKDEKETETTTAQIETTTEDPYAGLVRSKLTGEYVKPKIGNRRPVALMYNNIINAIPHSGISNADVLYEAPVEGSITRIMGVFENYDKLKKMGSVRSCRIYYAYFALEWDAVYCHYGQSKYALDFLKSDKIDNVCSFNYEGAYFRSSDRSAPHNCFATGKGMNKGIEALGYRKKYKDSYEGHFNFADYGTKLDLESDKIANKVSLGYPINKPYFVYNEQDGQYYRYQYDDKHIDDQNNEQLHCSNIIIQFVDATLYPDGKSLDMTLTGKGDGWFITNGKAEKITWEKSKKMGQTSFLNKNGENITLNTGKTWICIVQNEYSDDVKISNKK